jgi:WD40 repeat protein
MSAAVCALLLAALPSLHRAAPPPRTDLYGDPLPAGALVRFGSVRLRHAGLGDYVCLPDGKTVLTAGGDRVLRYWDLATGRQLRSVTLQGKAGPGRLVTLSPDGKLLTALVGEQLVIWKVETGKEVQRLPCPKWRLNYLYFSPDGKTLAAGREDYRVVLWDWRAAKPRALALAVHPRAVISYNADSTTHATFSPDGKWLIAGANSLEPLGVFDVATGREVYRFPCHARTSVVSPDSTTLVVSSWQNDKGGRESVFRFFDLKTGKEVRQFPQGNEDSFYSLAFSPDGKQLACGFSDTSRVLDATTGRVLYRLTGRPITMAYAPDGKTLLSSWGDALRTWDAATGKELFSQAGTFESTAVTAISPDGRLLASAGWIDSKVTVWETASGRLLRQLPLKGEGRYVRNLTFSPDGRLLQACQYKGFIQTWDAATGAERKVQQLNDLDHPNRRRGFEPYFYNFHLAPDGKSASTLERILSREEQSRLLLWDLPSGKLIRQRLFAGGVRDAAWHPDGRTAALPLRGGISLIDLEDGSERFHVPGPAAAPTGSPDGQLVAARLTLKDAVGVWESATGKEVATVPTGRVAHLALAAGNRFLVTADEAHLRVWDLADGKERRGWPLPVAMTDSWGRTFVHALRLTPDGRRAFTALADGTGLMWDVAPEVQRPAAAAPDEKTFLGWWADLAGADARKAFVAAWRLGEAPEAAVLPFLRRHLRPAEVAVAEKVRQHIESLDSDDFAARERAYQALESLGQAALPEVRRALDKAPGLEVRRRLEKLLAAIRRLPLAPEALLGLRALQVLEATGSPEARELLKRLAGGASHAPLTTAAEAALRRLEGRKATP